VVLGEWQQTIYNAAYISGGIPILEGYNTYFDQELRLSDLGEVGSFASVVLRNIGLDTLILDENSGVNLIMLHNVRVRELVFEKEYNPFNLSTWNCTIDRCSRYEPYRISPGGV
jgi:hypothetical protein